MGVIAMFDKLLQWLVKEIPEELSVCEFDCWKTECTVSDWTVCKLRRQVTAYNKGVIRHNTFESKTEATA